MFSKSFLSLIFQISLIILNFSLSHTEPLHKCRALALEGGGDAGSWQAGVIAGLVENLPANEVEYDVISGVSVGSINGLYVATYEKGDEKKMAEELLYRWGNLTQENIYVPWYNSSWTMWEAFYDMPSVFDNSPLKNLMDNYMKDRKVLRKMSIGITDATNVNSITYDIENFPNENITQLVLDSTAMPFMFPYVVFDNNSILIDGGVLLNVNVQSAVRRCKELGVAESDIIIDVILPTGFQIDKFLPNQSYTGFDLLERYRQILKYKSALDDIVHAFYDFKYVNFRHVIMPSIDLPVYAVPLAFNHDTMMEMIELGKKDAKNAIVKNKEIWDQILKRNNYKVVKYDNGKNERIEYESKSFLG